MTQLIIPPGKATGCLPRNDRCGERFPLFAERIKVIPQDEWAGLIGTIDLSSTVVEGIDQGQVGSCACASTTQALQMVRYLEGQPHELLNHEYIYHYTSGGRDNGSVIGDNIVFARDLGVAPISVWPRSHSWKETPSADAMEAAKQYKLIESYDIATVDEIGTALLEGLPVVFGWQGHSCVLTDLLSATRARYRNSWGDDWEDAGFGTINLSSINFSYGCHALRTALIHSKVQP
jgi:hypothetical protein